MATDQLGTQWRLGRQNNNRLFVPDHLRSTPRCRDEKKFRLLCKFQLHKCADIDPLTCRKITNWHFLNGLGCGCRLECLPCQAIRQIILLCGARIIFSLGFTLGVISLLASVPCRSLPAFEIRLKCSKTTSMIFDFFMGNALSIIDGLQHLNKQDIRIACGGEDG